RRIWTAIRRGRADCGDRIRKIAIPSHPIPARRERISQHETAFYALSIGLGQGLADERQLRLVDHAKELHANPLLALVVADPGRWLANLATGAERLRAMRGEEAIRIENPLPTEGEFLSQTRVTDIVRPQREHGMATDRSDIAVPAVSRAFAIIRYLT